MAGIPLTKKKIAELDLSLLHLQQNVEIPDISLPIPTLVQNAITQVVKLANRCLIAGAIKGRPSLDNLFAPGYHLRSSFPEFYSSNSKLVDQIHSSNH